MFTGLVQACVPIQSKRPVGSGFELTVKAPLFWQNISRGESIAVDGTCLTVTEFAANGISFYISSETTSKTSLALCEVGGMVNLERSLAFGDKMGGHFVLGHVDGIAQVIKTWKDGDCFGVQLQVPPDLINNIVPKGSLAVNGVSLSVNLVDQEIKRVEVLFIPETLARTNLQSLKVGDIVNIETDHLVKVIAHQLARSQAYKDLASKDFE